ncbi:MAG: hypothetical protein GY862_01385, partial [Gammaproteobacteria bacterium]|nr:hypothetical protein [Gammaproteobacteria bacterium]
MKQLSESLGSFIEELRLAGFAIGAAQHIAAQDLLLALAAQDELPADPARLRTLLAPVLCHSPQEQALFQDRFNDWLGRLKILESAGTVMPVPALAKAAIDTELEEISKGTKVWKWIFIAVAMTVVITGLLLYWPTTSEQSPETAGAATPVLAEPGEKKSSAKPLSGDTKTSAPAAKSYQQWHLWGLLLFLCALFGWHLWWRYQTRRFLARKTVSDQPEIKRLFLEGISEGLFQSPGLSHTAQQLRKHAQVEADFLDVEATLEQTVRCGGWLMPVTGTLKRMPEYLVLIDRIAFKDHQARLIDVLINRLAAEGVAVARYYFNADPRRCYPEQGPLIPCSPEELGERYPRARLLIFSDGNGLINPVSGEAVHWIEQFFPWPQRALFTLEHAEQWTYRQRALEDSGFSVLPASEAGLAALVEQMNAGVPQSWSKLKTPFLAKFPEILSERVHRWLERHPPAMLDDLLKQLRNFLGKNGYYWFSACAVYPELHWQLTLYLGYQLTSEEALPLHAENTLGKLARLPWFRYGYMPDWLRKRLINDLSLSHENETRAALQQFLLTVSPDNPLRDFHIEIAYERKAVLSDLARRFLPALTKRASKTSPLRDYVFLTFMEDKLAVKMPKVLRGFVAKDKKSAGQLFADMPIKRKLISMMMLATVFILLIASAVFVVNDVVTFRRNIVENLSSVAELMSYSVAAALAFDDRRNAERALPILLKDYTQITSAHIYDKKGSLFASYFKAGVNRDLLPNDHFFQGTYAEISRPIMMDSEESRLGTIYIRSTLDDNYQLDIFIYYLQIIMSALLLSLLLASKFHIIISKPILNLVEIVSMAIRQ